jgi:hypothetical protein
MPRRRWIMVVGYPVAALVFIGFAIFANKPFAWAFAGLMLLLSVANLVVGAREARRNTGDGRSVGAGP